MVTESELLVAFGDGIETDHLSLNWGQQVSIGVAPEKTPLGVATVSSRLPGSAGTAYQRRTSSASGSIGSALESTRRNGCAVRYTS